MSCLGISTINLFSIISIILSAQVSILFVHKSFHLSHTNLQSYREAIVCDVPVQTTKKTLPAKLNNLWSVSVRNREWMYIYPHFGGHCQANGFPGTDTFWQWGEKTNMFWISTQQITEKTHFLLEEKYGRCCIMLCKQNSASAHLWQHTRK